MHNCSPDFPLDRPDNSKARYEALDSLRGVAALAVALHHFQVASHIYFWTLTRNAYLFVEFFFVLSGFVIAHAYAGKVRNKDELRGFLIKRVGRVWPLHVTILLCFVLAEVTLFSVSHYLYAIPLPRPPFSGDRMLWGIPINLFMLNGIIPYAGAAWNAPSWSVSVELVAYLLFGLTALLPGRNIGMLVQVMLLLIALAALTFAQHVLPVERCIYSFFLGASIWRIRNVKLPFRLNATIMELIVVGATLVFLSLQAHRLQLVLAPILFSLVVLVLAAEGGRLSRWLKNSFALRLGLTSYSIYMVHFFLAFILTNVMKLGGKLFHQSWILPTTDLIIINSSPFFMDLITLIYLGLCIGLAQITYQFIERPGYVWARNRSVRRPHLRQHQTISATDSRN